MVDPRNKGGWASMSGEAEHNYSDLRFLIVDDEPFILDLVEKILRRCRAKEIRRLSNGKDALEVLKGAPNHFDVVISDCNMQPINGLQLLRGIREGMVSKEAIDLPVVFLTGHNDQPIVQRAVELKVSGFLSKPVSFEKLTSTIAKAVASRKAE